MWTQPSSVLADGLVPPYTQPFKKSLLWGFLDTHCKYLLFPDQADSSSLLPGFMHEATDPSSLPDSLDWRAAGAVSEVKNQGQVCTSTAISTYITLQGSKKHAQVPHITSTLACVRVCMKAHERLYDRRATVHTTEAEVGQKYWGRDALIFLDLQKSCSHTHSLIMIYHIALNEKEANCRGTQLQKRNWHACMFFFWKYSKCLAPF